jgi:5-formyltetrahydrofolate cyclo-ligase
MWWHDMITSRFHIRKSLKCKRRIEMDKPTLRREAMLRRDNLDGRDWRSATICSQILAMPADALGRGKGVAVPVVVRGADELAHAWLESLSADALEPGSFGTFNPRSGRPAVPGDWDLTIVPLLAFDRRGYRLGYGKGFYDRLLAGTRTETIGVAFAVQEINQLPAESHDVSLDWIVTEQETIGLMAKA